VAAQESGVASLTPRAVAMSIISDCLTQPTSGADRYTRAALDIFTSEYLAASSVIFDDVQAEYGASPERHE